MSVDLLPEHISRGLNDGQYAAVTASVDRHHLVLAGAGCGKTTVLTRRVAYLIHHGVPAEHILALTFTRKAAEEMAERISDLAPKTSKPLVTTFHAFALSVLSESVDGVRNFERIGFPGQVRLCEAEERLALLAKASTTGERRQLRLQLQHLDDLLERLEVFPERTDMYCDADRKVLSAIRDRFSMLKNKSGLWDFSDLLNGTVRLFDENSAILDRYRIRFSYILVDEFQDTNPVQIRLLHQVLGNEIRLFAVGDDDQAIYAFRGADIRPTLNFATCFSGASILKLETNYRSTTSILRHANRIFHDKDPLYRKVLVAGNTSLQSGEKPRIARCDDQAAAAHWIARQITRLSKSTSITIGDMAILFRTNQSLEWMAECFREAGSVSEMPQFLTVHKSKGLEFPVVFICDLEESLFPSYRLKRKKRIVTFGGLIRALLKSRRSDSPPEDLAEERRLFYVAVTRAKEHLFLLHVKNRQVYGRRHRFSPSRFLQYIK